MKTAIMPISKCNLKVPGIGFHSFAVTNVFPMDFARAEQRVHYYHGIKQAYSSSGFIAFINCCMQQVLLVLCRQVEMKTTVIQWVKVLGCTTEPVIALLCMHQYVAQEFHFKSHPSTHTLRGLPPKLVQQPSKSVAHPADVYTWYTPARTAPAWVHSK